MLKNPSILRVIALALTWCAAGCSEREIRQQIEPEPIDIHERARRLGRGINLGNALEGPQEGAWGVTIAPEYFDLIREAGFDSVRIPIRWSAHAQIEPPYAVGEDFFSRVDQVIDWSLSNGLVTVINIHHYEELMKQPEAHVERFLSLWRQISARYAAYPDSLYFELLNEPTDKLTPELWNDYLSRALAVVREGNPDRAVIVGTAEWGGLRGLPKLVLPTNDANIIATFHYYEPFHFTHQGAEWIDNSKRWLGNGWQGNEEEQQSIRRDFDKAVEWARSINVPLYMGEFGAYSRADLESRARWTACVAREAEERDITWAYWEFCSGFGVYDSAASIWNDALMKALLPSPHPAGENGERGTKQR